MSETLEAPLASERWLRAHHADVELVVVDTRWVLGEPGRGRAAYDEAHISGAIHLDVETDLSDIAKGGPGRHPLPSLDALRARLGAAGIGDDTRVVAYDDQGGMAAARLWFVLALLGHERARVLDGGLRAWTAMGGPLTQDAPHYPPRTLRKRPPLARVVDRAAVGLAIGRGALLLDARAPERFEGKVEPIDKRPGHIPTAKNAPFMSNLDARGRFHDRNALRARYEALGATEERSAKGDVIVYCGSGVTACHDALAMVTAGYPLPVLYEGSWSDWIHDGTLPEAIGAEPGEWPPTRP